MILEHDLPAVVHMGKLYPITVRTNLLGVNLYSSNSNIFQLHQLSGPQGEGNGDRYYHGTALRIGPFKLKLIDIHQSHIQESEHNVNF
jgi:hypothetical protein